LKHSRGVIRLDECHTRGIELNKSKSDPVEAGERERQMSEVKAYVPKFPEVEVELTGVDGNAFAVLAEVRRALNLAGVDPEDVKDFMAEATSGDYDHLLATVLATVAVA
jgi:hypothetical protein